MNTQTKEAKAAKQFAKAPATNLQRLIDAGITRATIANEIGVSETAIGKWLRDGTMSKVSSIACEALLRRSQGNSSMAQSFAVVTFEKSKCAQVKAVIEAMGASFYKLDT